MNTKKNNVFKVLLGLFVLSILVFNINNDRLINAETSPINNGDVYNNDSNYVYSAYEYTLEEYNTMYEEHNQAIKSVNDTFTSSDYPYFAGMDIINHHAVYTSIAPNPRVNLLRAASTTGSVKIINGGTWNVNGYWAVIIKDSNGNYYYCANHGLDVPMGTQSFTKTTSAKIADALSWGFPHVKTSASDKVDYAHTQMAVWNALKQTNINKSYLGVYQKVTDAYQGKIGGNSTTFNISTIANSQMLSSDNLNMSNYAKVSGSAKYHFSQTQLNSASANNYGIYVFNNTSKKYQKVTSASTTYQANAYPYIRLGSSDLSKVISVSNISILTDVKQALAYYLDLKDSSKQNLWVADPMTSQNFSTSLSLKAQVGSVHFHKVQDQYNKITNEPGATFIINDTKDLKTPIQTKTTDKNGNITFSNLKPGTYYIKQTKAPVNYSINATYFKVSISAGKTYEIVKDIINTYLLGNVELLKNANDIDLYTKTIHKDETTPYYASKDGGMVIYEDGTTLSNIISYPTKEVMVEQNLFNKPITYEYVDYDNVTITKDRLDGDGNKIPIYELDGDGNRIPINDILGNTPLIDDGTGMLVDNPLWTPTYQIKVDGDGNYVYETFEEQQYQTVDGIQIPIVKAKLIDDQQVKVIGTLPINYPNQVEMDNIHVLEGVEFSIYDSNNKLVKSGNTDNKGQLIFKDLKEGNYIIKETKTKDNYVLLQTIYKVTIKANTTIKLNSGKAIMNDEAFGSLIINKKDTNGKPIKDVVFDIYEANEDGSVNLDKLIDTIQTDYEGKAYWTYNTGHYVVIEKQAPNDYINEKQAQEFSIVQNETTELEYINKIKYDEVYVSKQSIGDKELPGANLCLMTNDKETLEIKLANGKEEILKNGVYCWKSTNKPYMFNVAIGDYIMFEQMAPKGYVKTSQTFPFKVVGNGKVHKITIKNEPIKLTKTGMNEITILDYSFEILKNILN